MLFEKSLRRLSAGVAVGIFAAMIPAQAIAQSPAKTKMSLEGQNHSDHLFLELEKDGSPNTIVYHGVSGNNQSLIPITPDQMGKHENGDIVVSADYTGDGVANMAIVRQANKRLRWIIHDGNEQLEPINFGRRGATVISGCHIRGQQHADLAFVRGRNFRYRDIAGDIPVGSFRLGGGRHQSFFCADYTGDGHDELIALSQRRQNIRARFFNVWRHDGEHIVRRANFGSRRKANVIAADINGDGKANIGFFRNIPAGSRLIFQTDSGDVEQIDLTERIRRPAGAYQLATGTHVTSNSGLADGISFAARGGGFFKFNFADRVLAPIDDSVIVPNNPGHDIHLARTINVVDTAAPAPGSGGGSGGSGGACGVDNMLSLACSNQSNCAPNLWKPVGDHTGTPVALFENKFGGLPNSVQVVRESDCSVLENANWGGWHNPVPGGPRSHWRFGKHCSSYGSNIIVRMNRSGQNVGMRVANPCTRYEYN